MIKYFLYDNNPCEGIYRRNFFMLLSELFEGQPDIEIKGLCIDSRKAQPGDLFFCLTGLSADGHRFAQTACEKGAVAVVHSEEIAKRDDEVYIRTEDVNGELNRVCDLFFGQPSRKMKVFGITGTNGKTTTTSIIRDVYDRPCGYMGTIAVRYGDVSRIPNLTTPDALEIHESLRDMADYGMEAVSMEVSSHGLAMGRTDSVDFDVVGFTNLSYDHLDYHKTMEAYLDAKAKLFEQMKPEGIAVLNADELTFEDLAKRTACGYVTYAIEKDADYRAENLLLATDGTDFTLVHGGKRYPVRTNLCAKYNIYNLLCAVACMHEAGMELEKIIPRLKSISPIDGRMENIDKGQDFTVIVDYAHTPDGFEKVFAYAKNITPEGSIYAVFGCAGKRDKVKRKVLGQVAGKYCRKVFVTEEDPRDERAEEIGGMILQGVPEGKGVFIADRQQAIETALTYCGKGDCLLILGKGDEPYMYYEDGRHPWIGDQAAAALGLEKILER